jgi:hypothetical protein
MARMRVLILAGVATWLAVSPCRAGALRLDQAWVPSPIEVGLVIQSTQTVAQVFRIKHSGQLGAVDVLIGCCRFGQPDNDLLVEIRTTAQGIPTMVVLASFTVPPADLAVDAFAFERIDLRPHLLHVQHGDVLALVLSSVDPVLPGGGINPYAWAGQGGYPGGMAYIERGNGFLPTGWDMGFRTYVVPEPSVLPAMATLLAGAWLVRRRRMRRAA